DRLLGLAWLHPHAYLGRGVALQPRADRDDGLHRLGMTARVKLGAQALAVGLVLALFALLIWKVAFKNNGGGVAAKIDTGKITAARDGVLRRLDGRGHRRLARPDASTASR